MVTTLVFSLSATVPCTTVGITGTAAAQLSSVEMRQNTKNVQNQNLRTEHEKKKGFRTRTTRTRTSAKKIDKTG